jgi:hypothetical protein
MEPKSGWLLDLAVGLTKRRDKALRWYNAVILPLGLDAAARMERASSTSPTSASCCCRRRQ